jgi:hypothetical protein
MSEYQAGTCNIGPSEIHRRYQSAILGGVIYLALSIYLIASDSSTSSRFVAFLPAMLASVGYIQTKNRFCFAYGLMGVFNFDQAGDVKKIQDPAALKADRKNAAMILIKSVVLAAVMTSLAVLL